jgi:NADH-ubiquinone oxidoreductase chain 1
MLGVLIRVAFIILLERKILGYIQIRKGPNKVGYLGILQSFGDAVKLFIKEQTIPSSSNIVIFYFSPVASLLIILLLWGIFPTNSNFTGLIIGGLLFFCCLGFGVYTLMRRGWSSNSFYAILGAIRGVAQTISYEVSLVLLFLGFIFILLSYNLLSFVNNQEFIIFFIRFIPIFFCWFVSSLAEVNRSPFDFAEGESELVSGFNIEYGRGGFALLFLAEYARIIFMSYVMSLFYFGGSGGLVILNLIGFTFCFIYIWVRGTLPRFRYDKLIYLCWKRILPISLNIIIVYIYIIVVIMFWNF